MMEEIERLKKEIENLLPSEGLAVEAFKDLVKDEVKEFFRQKLNENPELKKMLHEALIEYMEAKIKEGAAVAKVIKVAAALGLTSMPPRLKEELVEEILKTFRKEIEEVFKRL